MKKFIRIIAPVAVIVGGIGVVQAMMAAKPAPEKSEEAPRLISLFVDTVKSDTVTLSVAAQGEVRPTTEIDLVPHVSGRIVSISDSFAEGAPFNPQTSLLKIEDSDYQLAVARAEAQVAQAEVNLAEQLATASIKKSQWEKSNKGGEPTPLQINQPQINEARAQLKSAQAELADAMLDLERTEIRVPFEGRVRERLVGVGQYVTAGTTLGSVFSTDKAEVTLPLTDAQLDELSLPMGFVAQPGKGPEVRLHAIVGNRDHVWVGRITRTHAAVDRDTRMIHAVAEVVDPYGAGASKGVPLAVGLFVSADIEGVHARDALVMPRTALRNADEVYVVNDDDRLEIREVEVLSTSEERVLVASGVVPGERVVVSTVPNAVDGMQVQPLTQPQPTEQLASID